MSALRRATAAALVFACGSTATATAAQPGPQVGASLQSFSGVIETPHAQTLQEGFFSFSYNNHPPLPGLNDSSPESYILNFGLFDRFEIGGRLTESDGDGRDLIGFAKLRLFDRAGWPSLAVGIHDFQGNERFGSSVYAVSSWSPWNWMRVSGGYGFREELLDGAFGSVEVSPWRFLTLMGEYSDEASRAGAAVRVPIYKDFALQAKGAYDFDETDTTFSVELQAPLGAPRAAKEPLPPAPQVELIGAGPVATASGLRDAGFRAVRLNIENETAIACVDHVRFRSSVDALGVAFGLMDSRLPENVRTLEVILQRDGQAQTLTRVSRTAYRQFIETGDVQALSELHSTWTTGSYCRSLDGEAVPLDGKDPIDYDIVFSPHAVTFFGTEFGVLDIDLSLRARLQASFGEYGVFYVSLLSPAVRDSDFDDGGPLENERSRAGLDQLLYQKYVRPHRSWSMLFSAGYLRQFSENYTGIMLEHLFSDESGRHGLRLHTSLLNGGDGKLAATVADYIWTVPEQDLRFTVGAGRFAGKDTGLRSDLTRYFGDSSLTLFVRGESRHEAIGGILVSIPLIPRFWTSESNLRVRGVERYRHSAASAFTDEDGRNPLRPRFLIEPSADRNLRDHYHDMGRLIPDWTGENGWRMRDAYLDYLLDD